MKLWIAGHTSAADKVIDQIRALYPKDPWPWFIRVMILAMTGRSRAAAAMLDSQPELMGSSADVAIWRAGIAALASRSPSDIAKARETSIHAADAGPWLAGQSVMILSALGVVDSAFDIAEGFLLSRGPVAAAKSRVEDLASDAVARINTQWLFTPPCAAMRADARFLPLCEGMGLADYWAARGVRPDYQLKR
jgi:hypothetical protein